MTTGGMEFRVLGPLEARLDGVEVQLGGGKQRAVLAVLLLRAGEVVPVERLVDEVWGTDPPPSAAHTLESYVSRLRQLFTGHGPLLVRRGAGYALELGDARLDARGFCDLQERAALAAAMDEHAEVVELTKAALAMWRGPALADVALASAGRAEAERLEEIRLRTFELRFDSELALGQHERAVGELQALVAQNPYRERFVAQLMLALYRAGRHAEALEVYEQTRRRLDEDLGLQPSTDLQQLSGQVVRQDPALRQPAAPAKASAPVRQRAKRLSGLVLVGAATVAVMAISASGAAPEPAARGWALEVPELGGFAEPPQRPDIRVALVLPKAPAMAGVHDASVRDITRAVQNSGYSWPLETKTFVSSDLAGLGEKVDWNAFDVAIILASAESASRLAPVVTRERGTRFVFLDRSLDELSLKGAPNATAVRFAEEEASHLVGYLSGLMPLLEGPSVRADVVSVVGSHPSAGVKRVIRGFVNGLRRSRPGVRVLVDYSREAHDPTRCEAIANRQINAGADVVFAVAGQCGKGALAVAKLRGVWGIGSVEDGALLRGNVLAVTVKDWWALVTWVFDRYGLGHLEPGDVVRGLDDDYAVIIGTNDRVSEQLWSKVVERCSEIRRASPSDA